MSPISIALIILAVTVILFIWEPVPIIVTAIGASIAFAYGAAFCGIHHNILCSAFIQLDGGIFQASPIFCANKSTGFCDFSVIDRFKSQIGDLTVLKFECLPCRAV